MTLSAVVFTEKVVRGFKGSDAIQPCVSFVSTR